MPTIIVPISIVGLALFVFIFFLLKRQLVPRRIEAVHDYLKQGKLASAIRGAKAIIDRDPRNVDAHYLLGKAYLEDNRPELALSEYHAINRLGFFGRYCREKEFRAEAASLYAAQGHLEEALKEHLLLAQMEPDVAEHYYRAGELLERRRNTEKAPVYYRKAVRLDPAHSGARFRLGYLLYRSNHMTEAKVELLKAIKQDPGNCGAHFYLGKLLKIGKDHNGALQYFEKAQRDPALKVKTLIERGGSYISLHQYDRAVSELSRAVRLSENDGEPEALYSRYFLSIAYEKTRQLDKAIELWETIYALKPSFQDVAERLSHYQDIREDDNVKDYLTCNQRSFQEMCQNIVRLMEMEIRETAPIQNGCQIVAAEVGSKWRNVRKMPHLVRFLRVPDPVAEGSIRQLLEDMQKLKTARATVFTSSTYTRKAVQFASTRPIELMGKTKLKSLLTRLQRAS